jgi:pentatricopeptide repeat protein
MRQLGVKPNATTYNALINMFLKLEEVDEAFALLEKMRKEDNLHPNMASYYIFIKNLLGRNEVEKARELFDEMKQQPGCDPYSVKRVDAMINKAAQQQEQK